MNRVPWWVWASATPMGLGAWTPIVPGRQRGRPRWIAAGVLWSVIVFAGWVLAIISDGGAGGGLLIILGWVGGLANNASAAALTTLPGIDAALATRIVELRAELNGFASVHDLGGLIDLDGNAVERLEDRVVFLPRY